MRVGVGSTPCGDTAGLTKLNLVCLLDWMTGQSSRTAVVLHNFHTGSGGPLSLTLFLWITRSAVQLTSHVRLVLRLSSSEDLRGGYWRTA